MVVLEEGGVAVDSAAESFSQDQLSVGDAEARMEASSGSALDAMVRPEGLGSIGDLDSTEGAGTRMRRGEGDVSGWMPVLGEDDMLELLAEPVDEGDDLITVFDGERSAGTEIVLQVDDDERVGGLGSNGHRYLLLPVVF